MGLDIVGCFHTHTPKSGHERPHYVYLAVLRPREVTNRHTDINDHYTSLYATPTRGKNSCSFGLTIVLGSKNDHMQMYISRGVQW